MINTGLHGANRLASNSLLECVVIGRNIAKHLPTYLRSATWTSVVLTDIQPITLPLFNVMTEHHCNSKVHSAIYTIDDFHKITAKLKALMSNNMGITRSAELLVQALEQIQGWQESIRFLGLDDLIGLSNIDSVDNTTTPNHLVQFRIERQLRLATLIVQSAYQRCESRGGHYRKDYPDLAKNPLISVIEPLINKADTMNDPLEWLSSPILTVNSA